MSYLFAGLARGRESKVTNLDVVVRGEKDVLALQVAVHHAQLVHGFEALAQLHDPLLNELEESVKHRPCRSIVNNTTHHEWDQFEFARRLLTRAVFARTKQSIPDGPSRTELHHEIEVVYGQSCIVHS